MSLSLLTQDNAPSGPANAPLAFAPELEGRVAAALGGGRKRRMPSLKTGAKLAAGLVAGVVGLYTVYTSAIETASTEAVVSARLTTIRAPIAGQLKLEVGSIGARVSHDTNVAAIANQRIDTGRLEAMRVSARTLESEISTMNVQRAALEAFETELNGQWDAFRTGRVRQLDGEIEGARAGVAAVSARLKETSDALGRRLALVPKGFVTKEAVDQARRAADVARADLTAAQERLRNLEAEKTSAESGVFVREGNNDRAYSSQRRDEIRLKLIELKSAVADRRARLVLVQQQIEIEGARMSELRAASLTIPTEGRLWQTMVGSGEYVREGQEISQFVDCNQILVVARLTERDFNRLSIGMPAKFTFRSGGESFEGKVVQLIGPSESTARDALAVRLASESGRFAAVLSFPQLSRTLAKSCEVGRTGKVVFERPAGWSL